MGSAWTFWRYEEKTVVASWPMSVIFGTVRFESSIDMTSVRLESTGRRKFGFLVGSCLEDNDGGRERRHQEIYM